MAKSVSSKLPWLKFYPADWRADPALRMCSIAARGLWMEMLCLMHEAEPTGSLLINGKPVMPRQLGALAALPLKEVEALIVELEESGVFSRDEDGTIFSRRMRRDVVRSVQAKAFGSNGGNPKLKGNGKGGDNPPHNLPDDQDKPGVNPSGTETQDRDNPQDKFHPRERAPTTQRPEARKKDNPEPAAPYDPAPAAAAKRLDFDATAGPTDEFRETQAACIAALGDIAPADAHFGPMMLLIDKGFPLRSVVTVLRSFAAKPPKIPVKTWSLWTRKVSEQLASVPRGEPPARTVLIRDVEVPEFRVKAYVDRFYADGSWYDLWGPPPGSFGCCIPVRFLKPKVVA